MRWLLDQGLPRSAAKLLEAKGHDAVHVSDLGMAAAADAGILDKALELHRAIVTLDADFHDLLARSGAAQPTVLRIREEGLKAPELASLVSSITSRFRLELETGCVMTYRQGNIRYRKLPLG